MLQVEYVDLATLKQYKGNAKEHPIKQIEQIKASIDEFGFLDPIGVWHDTIVEGHGRYLAAVDMGLEQVPIIRLDDLTDEQRRAYTLVHNKLTMNSGFDIDMLNEELENIFDINMEQFDLEIVLPDFDDAEEEDEDTRDPSCQHNVFENQEVMQFPITNKYGLPDMTPTETTGDKFLRFMDWKEADDLSEYIAHFYYDDYKFMSAWREPDKYIERLRQFKAVVSPDFSLYTDFPRALQILSCYRRQWCGAYWQYLGLDVIPDVVWGERDSFDFCFDGIPKGGTVAVSSVGVKNDDNWNNKDGDLFKAGYDEMMNRLEPKTILFYGDMIDGLEGNIIQIPSYYAQKREYLNQKAKEKNDGQRFE